MIFACIAVFTILWAITLRYDLWMFQQNSYIASRYLAWYESDLLSNTLSKGLRKGAKVPFKVTKRVVRLIIFCVLIAGFLIGASLAYAGTACALAVMGAILLLDKALVVSANWLASPLEAAIRRWYINDARRILRSNPDLIIIGVTGSYGKTSTKNYLYRILSERYNVLITPGNFNTTLGVVRTIRESLKPYHQVFIVEMGAKRPGDIKEICDLVHPRYGIVTAVGAMHLETFGSLENIQRTKFELVRSLPADGVAYVNADSAGVASYTETDARCRTVGYGISNGELRAEEVESSPRGTTFSVGGVRLDTRLLGSGNVLDILGALGIAETLGVPQEAQVLAVRKLTQVEHRLSVSIRGGLTVLDDAYNSNPEGAAMALEVLRTIRLPEGARRFVVTPGFVEMGERQQEACEAFGRECAEKADVLVVVNRLNREAICAGAASMGESLVALDSLQEAAAFIGRNARPGDAVLYENDLPDSFR